MQLLRVLTVVACAAAVAGCAPKLNETNFAAGREAVIGSPAFYQRHVSECVTAVRANPKALEMNALLTGAPKERAAEIACERITKAYRDGRYKYEYYAKISSGSYDPELVKIMQGR